MLCPYEENQPLFDKNRHRYLTVLIVGPYAVGKDSLTKTVVHDMINRDDSLESKAVIIEKEKTRDLRPDEIDGSDFRHVSMDVFKQRAEANYYAAVFDNDGQYYGISQQVLHDMVSNHGKRDQFIVIGDRDGFLKLKQVLHSYGVDALPIFIYANEADITLRLKKRGTSDQVKISRTDRLKGQLSLWSQTQTLEQCVAAVRNASPLPAEIYLRKDPEEYNEAKTSQINKNARRVWQIINAARCYGSNITDFNQFHQDYIDHIVQAIFGLSSSSLVHLTEQKSYPLLEISDRAITELSRVETPYAREFIQQIQSRRMLGAYKADDKLFIAVEYPPHAKPPIEGEKDTIKQEKDFIFKLARSLAMQGGYLRDEPDLDRLTLSLTDNLDPWKRGDKRQNMPFDVTRVAIEFAHATRSDAVPKNEIRYHNDAQTRFLAYKEAEANKGK